MRTLKVIDWVYAYHVMHVFIMVAVSMHRAAMSTRDPASVYLIATNVRGNMEVMSSRLQGGQLNPGANVCVGSGPDGLRKCKYNYKRTCGSHW